jgi:hypothetical protein
MTDLEVVQALADMAGRPPELFNKSKFGILRMNDFVRPEFELRTPWIVTEWVPGKLHWEDTRVRTQRPPDSCGHIIFMVEDYAITAWRVGPTADPRLLPWDEFEVFCGRHGFDTVPFIGLKGRAEAVFDSLGGITSQMGHGVGINKNVAKGIVARPQLNIYDDEGRLIWWKLRCGEKTQFHHNDTCHNTLANMASHPAGLPSE